MKKLLLLAELEYDDNLFHNGDADPESKEWFRANVLRNNELLLHDNNEVGDTIGTIRVLAVSEEGVS